jgi:hypothetical protein
MRLIVWMVAVLVSGCVFQDRAPVPAETNFPDAGLNDAGHDAAQDVATDAQPDAEPDTAPDAEPDTEPDTAPDAEPDMVVDICLDELPLTNLSSGRICPTVAPITETSICDIVTQTGCNAFQYCDFVLRVVQGTPQLQAECVDAVIAADNTCEFLAAGEVCYERATVDSPVNSLGKCYPGNACPAIRGTQLQSFCVPWCKLDTGLGCETNEFCTPSIPEMAAYGVGRCAPTTAACLN